MQKFRALDDKEAKLNTALTEYCDEPVAIYSGGLGLVLDILIDAMDDHYDLILSFIYDAEFGERNGMITYKIEGKEYIINSVESLYDALVDLSNA